MNEELFFWNEPGTADDSLTVNDLGRVIEFEVDAPWYGSTEGGFGANLSINVSREGIEKLHAVLGAWLTKTPKE